MHTAAGCPTSPMPISDPTVGETVLAVRPNAARVVDRPPAWVGPAGCRGDRVARGPRLARTAGCAQQPYRRLWGSAAPGLSGPVRDGVTGDGCRVPVHVKAATTPYNVRTGAWASSGLGRRLDLYLADLCLAQAATRNAVRVGWGDGRAGSERDGKGGGGRLVPVHEKAATTPYNVRKGVEASFGTGWQLGTAASPMPLCATTLYTAARVGWRWLRSCGTAGRAGLLVPVHETAATTPYNVRNCVQVSFGTDRQLGTAASPMPLCATTLYTAVLVGWQMVGVLRVSLLRFTRRLQRCRTT